MTDANRQIFNLAADGFSAEEISSALGYSAEAVQMVLAEPRIAKKSKSDEALANNVSSKLACLEDRAVNVIAVLLERSEDDNVKSRLATYITDHGLGLKKPTRSNNISNIVIVQQELEKMRGMYGNIDKAIEEAAKQHQQIINVESVAA